MCCRSPLTHPVFALLCRDAHTHPCMLAGSRGEVERPVLACHLSSALTLALITAAPLANAPSLGCWSMCGRRKRRREFAPGNANSSHYGIRKSVWCDRQFTPAAKRSFCFSPSAVLSLHLTSGSGRHFQRPESKNPNKRVRRSPAPGQMHIHQTLGLNFSLCDDSF